MAFFRRPDSSVVADYQAQTGTRPRVMGWASGPRVELLAFPDRFAVRFGDQPWQEIGWHQVRSGGWRSEGEIHWRLVDGGRDSYHVTDERNFPEVFRERVQASIALDESFELETGGAVQVSARRDLSQSEPRLIWTTIAVRGASLNDPATRQFAERIEAQLRADYDF
ncbi:hypothetical protein [Luteococcus peritonei]|uniref:Uncharacterized protein n=1 Tax=Luteococcus peritonei TaxID=88874 RepID=A0ABW4RW53_9ACTN